VRQIRISYRAAEPRQHEAVRSMSATIDSQDILCALVQTGKLA